MMASSFVNEVYSYIRSLGKLAKKFITKLRYNENTNYVMQVGNIEKQINQFTYKGHKCVKL